LILRCQKLSTKNTGEQFENCEKCNSFKIGKIEGEIDFSREMSNLFSLKKIGLMSSYLFNFFQVKSGKKNRLFIRLKFS